MLKTELISRVSELETKFSNEKRKIDNILNTISKLLYGKDNTYPTYTNANTVDNINELFYEIWKLVEFRNNVLEEKWYMRDKESNTRELEYLRNKLGEIK